MSKVSIIIPAYNQARFLERTIQSVINQTFRDLEIIVVNDGSSDDTGSIAARYQGMSNFKLINQSNMGVAQARNQGFRESSGEYIVFLDGDDTIHPQHVEKLSKILDDNPSLGFVYCDDFYIDENDNPSPVSHFVGKARKILSGNITSSLMLGGYFAIHAVMTRRKVIEEAGGFKPELRSLEDYEFWLRISMAGNQTYYLDEKLANYRRLTESRSRDGYRTSEVLREILTNLSRQYPEATGEAASFLQEFNLETSMANQWLLAEMDELRSRCNFDAVLSQDDTNTFHFYDNAQSARLTAQSPGKLALGAHIINQVAARTIFLHPPAKLEYQLPTSLSGKLCFAVTMHPAVWENTVSGSCTFLIHADNRQDFTVQIDPVHHPADRRWHEYTLDIPPSYYGNHRITFETQSPASLDYRWALWRAPVFCWTEKI
ncbi:glycosyltransferase [bacterium]|nr:MAG: glycosyltransferase [bacterium]